jgi:hypothetical protein
VDVVLDPIKPDGQPRRAQTPRVSELGFVTTPLREDVSTLAYALAERS